MGEELLQRGPGRIGAHGHRRGQRVEAGHRDEVVLRHLADAHVRDDRTARPSAPPPCSRRARRGQLRQSRWSRWLRACWRPRRAGQVLLRGLGKGTRHRVGASACGPWHHQLDRSFGELSGAGLRCSRHQAQQQQCCAAGLCRCPRPCFDDVAHVLSPRVFEYAGRRPHGMRPRLKTASGRGPRWPPWRRHRRSRPSARWASGPARSRRRTCP